MKKLLLILLVLVLAFGVSAQEEGASFGPLVQHGDQELFLNGINLAWVNFARDLQNFDEVRFVAALDELAAAKGNTLRWWLHTNGSASPVYDEASGLVTGLGENDIVNFRRAVDLAYERGILIMPTLWSHDMMNDVQGVPVAANKLMIEDPTYTQAYIDNALIPLVEAMKGHPGIVAWEIFNEPEGTTDAFGWTDIRTDMASIQQFVNLLTGAIRRTDPDAQITNGSWNMRVLTDVDGFFNYYTDERLIEAGGDADGWLDFYQVHYYPEWFDETTSPFHNPYSYWELDKPLVVGEFPATAIADLGMGFQPRRQLRNSWESYEFLLENGYAGALSWMFYESPHGSIFEATPGILRISNLAPDNNFVDIGDIDRIPAIQQFIDNAVINNDVEAVEGYVNLADIFADAEDGVDLTYEVIGNSRSDIVEVTIGDDYSVSLNLAGVIGTSAIQIQATDSSGNFSNVQFMVQVVDPNQGNVALGKTAIASTDENLGYLAEFAVDGLDTTRWSSEYVDGQYIAVDLGGVFTISQVILRWETAHGAVYDIQVWDGSSWVTVYNEIASDGEVDDITFDAPVDTRFIRMDGTLRATEWGFSLWEFEVNGIADPDGNTALETVPEEFEMAAAESAEPTTEETVLHDFEDSENPFTLADYWSGGTSLEVADDGALSMGLSTSGAEWQEGGFFTQPGGIDWSAYDQLAVDVYVPEGASDFTAQIFIKTGDDWTWANTAGTTPIEDDWVTVTADLADMGDSSAIMEYGLKIGSSLTAFEGTIQVDNFRLIALVATDAVSAPLGEDVILHTFDADVEGFVLADYWPAGTSVKAVDGALAIDSRFSGAAWEETGVFFNPEGGVDWSMYDTLSVDIYLPEGADGFISQIFVKTGDDWTWANTPDTPLTAGEWTTISATLADLGDASALYEYGVKVGTSSTNFSGEILIDNVRLSGSGSAEVEEVAAPTGVVDAVVNEITSVTPLSDTVGQYEKFEIVVAMDAQFNNPYDPVDIRLDGQFKNPAGETITAPGFYMEEFETVGSRPLATGDFSWRVRFAPMQTGNWEYRVIATTLSGRAVSEWQTFTVTDSDNPGFIRVDERNPRYFAFDDGSPYFPVGENIGWSTGQPIADYDMWLASLESADANFIRVWMASWGFGIEWLDTGLGDYSNRQNRAYQLDEVLNIARDRDIYIMLSLLNHGAFNVNTDPEWNANPYNAANGGPLENPEDFATNPEAHRLWNQRLRYIAARWGYSTNIMTWEWWNEVNWTPLASQEILAPWIERSAVYLDNLDPYDHLMTHSGSVVGDEMVWNLDSMDFVQDHQYNLTNLNRTFENVISSWIARYPDKPFLMGEFGSPSEFDLDGILLHHGLWSAPMNGAAGTAMTWWWDNYIHPNDLYYHFAGISAFYADEDLAASTWQPTTADLDGGGALVVGMQTDNRALLWVVSRDYSDQGYLREYQQNLRNGVENPLEVTFDAVENVILSVDNLQTGTYTIEVWDTITGEIIQTSTFNSVDGAVLATLPSFTTDIAIKVIAIE